nr:copia protein [Tanacetum cinerariifolium]
VPADGVLAGRIVSAEFGDPCASASVPAVLTTAPAAASPLPPGHSFGSCVHTTRFPSPSDLGNHQPTADSFSSYSYDDDFCTDVTNLALNVVMDPGVPDSVPADGVLAGRIVSAEFGDPCASASVPAVLTTAPAAASPLPPGHSLGSCVHTTRFPSPSDLGNHQPTADSFSSSSYDDDFCTDVTNLALNVVVDPVATKRVNTIHPQSQIIRALQSPVQTRSTIAIGTKWILKNKRDAWGIVVYVDDIIFGSTNKAWCDEFEVLIKGEFEMSAIGELTFFLGLQVKQLPDGI